MEYPDIVEYDGERWYWWKDYYKNRTGKLLHRRVYERERGPIPPKFHVHHIDGNRRNFKADNLRAVSASTHLSSHAPRGFKAILASSDGFQWRAALSNEIWARRKLHPKRFVCAVCESEYFSAGMRVSKFCSRKCKQTDRRRSQVDYVESSCVVCGARLWRNKYQLGGRLCSRACGRRARERQGAGVESPSSRDA